MSVDHTPRPRDQALEALAAARPLAGGRLAMAKIVFFLTPGQIRELAAIEKGKHAGGGGRNGNGSGVDVLERKGWIRKSWSLTKQGRAVLELVRELELDKAGAEAAERTTTTTRSLRTR